jgi:hypothetical protein
VLSHTFTLPKPPLEASRLPSVLKHIPTPPPKFNLSLRDSWLLALSHTFTVLS